MHLAAHLHLAEVESVAESVAVGVGLAGVERARAVVAGVAESVTVAVHLTRVRHKVAIVVDIADSVTIAVARQPASSDWRRTFTCVANPVLSAGVSLVWVVGVGAIVARIAIAVDVVAV